MCIFLYLWPGHIILVELNWNAETDFLRNRKRIYQWNLIWSVLIWHYPAGVKSAFRIFYNNYRSAQADVRCLMCLSECNKTSLQMSDQWKSFVIQNIRFWSHHESDLICFAGRVLNVVWIYKLASYLKWYKLERTDLNEENPLITTISEESVKCL